MSATTHSSYEYRGYNIRIDRYRQPQDHDLWTATYRITRASDGALATHGAIAGVYRLPKEAEAGAKNAAYFWIETQVQS